VAARSDSELAPETPVSAPAKDEESLPSPATLSPTPAADPKIQEPEPQKAPANEEKPATRPPHRRVSRSFCAPRGKHRQSSGRHSAAAAANARVDPKAPAPIIRCEPRRISAHASQKVSRANTGREAAPSSAGGRSAGVNETERRAKSTNARTCTDARACTDERRGAAARGRRKCLANVLRSLRNVCVRREAQDGRRKNLSPSKRPRRQSLHRRTPGARGRQSSSNQDRLPRRASTRRLRHKAGR